MNINDERHLERGFPLKVVKIGAILAQTLKSCLVLLLMATAYGTFLVFYTL